MRRSRFMPPGMLAISADSWGLEFDCATPPSSAFEVRGEFAVVSIEGPLMQQSSWMWDSYEAISTRVGAALASAAPALLLRISSPGGQVAGCFELADEIRQRAANANKRVVAYVDGQATSAAYALACSASQIFIPATGVIGSIGTLQVALDVTAADRNMGLGFELFTSGARKADGNPHVALNDGSRAAIQGGVEDMAATFFDYVSKARALSPDVVKSFEAAVFVGSKGVAAGLADAVKTLAEVVAGGQQITAQTSAGERAMNEDEKKAKAALKALAEGDDKDAAARAKKALAAYGDDDGDADKKDDKKSDAKADDDTSDDDDDADKKDDKKSDAKADDDDDGADAKAAAVSPGLALASSVQSLMAWKQEQEEATERATLMSSRPDFAPEVVAFLKTEKIDTVRKAVKTFPRGTSAKGQVAAARAAIDVQATIGKDVDQPRGLEARDAEELDRLMGLTPANAKTEPYHDDRRGLVLPTITPTEARKRKAEADAKASKGGK